MGGASEDETSVVRVLFIVEVEVEHVDRITGTESGVVVLFLANKMEGLRVVKVIIKSCLVSCEPVEVTKASGSIFIIVFIKVAGSEIGLTNLVEVIEVVRPHTVVFVKADHGVASSIVRSVVTETGAVVFFVGRWKFEVGAERKAV